MGSWKDGKKEGLGIYIFISGSRYTGEWKEGMRNGQGSFTWFSGEKYVGKWRDGVSNGNGIFSWTGNEKYFTNLDCSLIFHFFSFCSDKEVKFHVPMEKWF